MYGVLHADVYIDDREWALEMNHICVWNTQVLTFVFGCLDADDGDAVMLSSCLRFLEILRSTGVSPAEISNVRFLKLTSQHPNTLSQYAPPHPQVVSRPR